MQTFNYLVQRFMAKREAWLAQAIVSQLRALKAEAGTEDLCVGRLLPVWEVIAENLQRRAMQSDALEPDRPAPFEYEPWVLSQRVWYEA